MTPRADVGGGGLVGALTVVFGLLLSQGVGYDYNTLVAALTVIFVFATGYLVAGPFKSFAVAVAAFIAVIVAALVGALLGNDLDTFALSAALAGIAQAAVTYLARPRDPDSV